MGLNCCSVSLKKDEEYNVKTEYDQVIKVYKANCLNPKCVKLTGGLVLELHTGICGRHSKILRGLEAKEFNEKYPKPIESIIIPKAPDKATYLFGKSIDRTNKTKKQRTRIDNSYSLSTGKKHKEEFKELQAV